MKKKLMILSLMAASLSFSSVEGQLRFGYDFLRSVNEANSPLTVEQKVNPGFNLSAEIIPLNLLNNRIELGAGIHYGGGLFSLYPTVNKADNDKTKVDYAYQVPIYGLAKFNLINLENGDTPLFLSTRLGYSFLGKVNKEDKQDLKGGIYTGVGIGSEFRNFVVEVVYNGTFFKSEGAKYAGKEMAAATAEEPKPETWKGFHKIGVEVGFRMGAPKFVKPEIVEKPAPKPEPKPEPTPAPKPEKPKHGQLVMDVATHKDTGLKLGGYSLDSLPEIIYLNENGYIETSGDKIVGSKGTTDAKHVYILNPDDTTLLRDGKPLILTVFRTQDILDGKYVVKRDKNGLKVERADHKVEKVEKPALFPSHCSDEEKKCIINGFAVDGRLPNEGEIEQIKLFVDTLNGYAKNAKITIVGHTDSTGSDAYNLKLGKTRATNISNLLTKYGLKPEIKILGVETKGEREPRTTNDTKNGRYINRRVEILFDEMEK